MGHGEGRERWALRREAAAKLSATLGDAAGGAQGRTHAELLTIERAAQLDGLERWLQVEAAPTA